MPSVHAAAARHAADRGEESRRGLWISLASLLLLLGLVGGGGWWWWSRREDPRITEFRQFTQDLAKKYDPTSPPKGMLDTAARMTAMVSWFAKVQSLPEALRPAAFREGEKVMMTAMQSRVNGYFATPPEKRGAYIDEQIRNGEAMRKMFEGNASKFSSLMPNRGQGGGGGGPPGPPGGRSRSEDDRNAWRKNMIDRSSPQQRARFNEYFGAMERRMREQGIQPGGGPRR